jgi:hypothetical protein
MGFLPLVQNSHTAEQNACPALEAEMRLRDGLAFRHSKAGRVKAMIFVGAHR